MNIKNLSIILVALAIIASAVAFVYNAMSSEVTARELAKAKSSEEAISEAQRKAAEAAKFKAKEERITAESRAKAQADAKEAAQLENENAELKLKAETENRIAKEAEAKAAEASREEALLKQKAAANLAKAAQDEKEKAKSIEQAKSLEAEAQASKLEQERLRSEKIIAEAKLKELARIDLEAWQNELIRFKFELDEREKTLRPDKTAADLAWVGGENDNIVDSNGVVRAFVKDSYLAENDMSLPRQTRKLAKVERLSLEHNELLLKSIKERTLARLEKLYIQALKEDRVIDAEYYKENILTVSPDWKFKGEDDSEEKNK